jgi:hypothetical protein
VIGRWSILRFRWAFPARPISLELLRRRQVTHPADIVKRLDPDERNFRRPMSGDLCRFSPEMQGANASACVVSNK